MMDSSSLYSQGEDGPPGNGTEGFPGFPVSAIDLPIYLPRPAWYLSDHLGTWMDEKDQSNQLVWAFGPGPLSALGPSTCGSHLAAVVRPPSTPAAGPWYNHPMFLRRVIQATEAPLG